MLQRLLQKGPTVLGAQASSPARVQRNQLGQWLLVRRDTGRRGRLRSQDCGAFLQEPIQLVVTQPTRNLGSLGPRLVATRQAKAYRTFSEEIVSWA